MIFFKDVLFNFDGIEFNKAAFDSIFAEFDKDNSGTIDKKEMIMFIKKLSSSIEEFK